MSIHFNKNGNYVVYVNWDGFAWYYYDFANRNACTRTPVINSLAREGILFTNACTGIPSITAPMQSSIVTGEWPVKTGNCYAHYDKVLKKIVSHKRRHDTKNIAELCSDKGIAAVSIHQFIFENRGTQTGNTNCPYISLGDNKDNNARMNEFIKLLNGEEIGTGSCRVRLAEMPGFTAIYSDDLDGIGHNEKDCYGSTVAHSEEMRLKNILSRLEEMDRKLGEVIVTCKDIGIYDRISFFLTSDHGMTPFGCDSHTQPPPGTCKRYELLEFFGSCGINASFINGIDDFDRNADVLLLTHGLCVQVYLLKDISYDRKEEILDRLKCLNYLEKVLDRNDLKHFCRDEFCDIYLSPVPPFHFSKSEAVAGAQHDSLNDTSQHVFSLAWGNSIRKGFRFTRQIYNIDFMPVMCKILGIRHKKIRYPELLDSP